MKVFELIEKLKDVPQDYDIRMCVPNGDEIICHDFENDIEVEVFEEDKIIEFFGL